VTAGRLGVVLSAFTPLPAAEFRSVAREAEARGYHTAWVGEVAGYDAISVMTLIASATERIRVASAVVPVQTRTPVVLGLSAASLNHFAPGRVALGLGLSSRVVVAEWHGLAFAPSLQQVREAVRIIRLVAAGERVNVEGKFYRVKNFRMTAPPPAAPVRVFLAALGAEMLELAGEIADGVVLNWIPPETVPASIKHLEAGAHRAGRTLTDFEIAAFIRTCATDDAAGARAALAREITGYATVDAYASFFRSAGFGDDVDAVTTAWKAGDRAGAVKRVSPRFLDALGVVGPDAVCRARIGEFARGGLTQPVILPFAPVAAAGREPGAALLRTLRAFP
jgi:probable F420-dependent oxidoreductase